MKNYLFVEANNGACVRDRFAFNHPTFFSQATDDVSKIGNTE